MQMPSPRTGGPTTPGAGSSPSKIFGSTDDEDVKPLPETEFNDFHGKYDSQVSRTLDLDEFMKEDEENFKFSD